MIKDPDFYTVTMARVYEEQGHLDKAAEIYRFLIKDEPERRDLIEALAEIDRKMDEALNRKPDDLIPLFREWITLLLRYSRLQKLRRLKGGM
jgi:hypothetical protein